MVDVSRLPDDLTPPTDDGGAAHMDGTRLPAVSLPATNGTQIDLSRLPGRLVLYVYPMTGQPNAALPAPKLQLPRSSCRIAGARRRSGLRTVHPDD